MKRLRALPLAAGAVAFLCSAAAAGAHVPDANPITAQMYFANTGTDSIGRAFLLLDAANPDPADVDPALIEGASDPRGIAIDGSYIYWANSGTNSIGRGNFDATGVIHTYFSTGEPPAGVAIGAEHIYWTQPGQIGRARLDGSGVNPSLATAGAAPCGVAATPGHLIWANGGSPGSLGRSSLDGGSLEQAFISSTSDPCGVAVTQDHIYWANQAGSSIGRANLDGTGAVANWLPGASNPPLANPPCGVAVDGGHLYWTSSTGNSIGRARLDGTIDTQQFVTGLSAPCGIAVAPTITSAPLSDRFPATEVGRRSGARPYTIANTSSSAVDNSTVNIVGANPSDFRVGFDGCTADYLPPAGECSVRVRFQPSAPGPRRAQVRLSGNASNHPFLIPLRGRGKPDRTKPRVTDASVRGAGRRRLVRYRLSESARVVFAVRRAGAGRVARFAQKGRPGENRKSFSAGSLPPGAYAVTIVATDRAGNRSRPRSSGFRVR